MVLSQHFAELQEKVAGDGVTPVVRSILVKGSFGLTVEQDCEELFKRMKAMEEMSSQVELLTKQLEHKQKELDEMKASLEAQKEESDAYLGEIDDISKELDQVQEQNTRLVEKVSDKDTNNQRLMKEV